MLWGRLTEELPRVSTIAATVPAEIKTKTTRTATSMRHGPLAGGAWPGSVPASGRPRTPLGPGTIGGGAGGETSQTSGGLPPPTFHRGAPPAADTHARGGGD